MQASDETEYKRALYMHILKAFLNNDHRSGDKASIYSEAEAEAKFMILLQTLFTLKQKHEGVVTAVNQLQYIYLTVGLHSVTERQHLHSPMHSIAIIHP
jgi:hypothetical protein